MGPCGGSAEFFEVGGAMTKPDTKRPFHEVLSTRLDIAVFGISRSFGHARATEEVGIILNIPLASKMLAGAAHQFAEYFANLPGLLTKAGEPDLAKFAERVLADLKGREDKKKEEAQPVVGAQ